MLKMRRGQGNRHFQISKAISAKMKAGSPGEHRERLVAALGQTQMRLAFQRMDNAIWASAYAIRHRRPRR
jgi:hypothetical protein